MIPARLVLSALGWLCLTACRSQPEPTIELQVGPRSNHVISPKTTLARYVEHPTRPDQLRIIISNYELGCDSFKKPSEGEVFVTVTVLVPPGEEIESGSYPWRGDLEKAKNGETASALPFVRLAHEGRPLPAGGELMLDSIEKKLHGTVTGQLQFQDGGEGQPKTAGLRGAFSARMCDVSLDATRRQDQ